MASLRSFDVFDTVVTRLVGDPVSVFLLVGQAAVKQALWRGTPEQFASARVTAETRARTHAAPREVTFDEIYLEFRNAYALTERDAQRLASLELETERRLLRAVPGIARELTQARRDGGVVHFISDMYLPHDVLHSWLSDLGALQKGDSLWLSSQKGETKGGGGLYDMVLSSQRDSAANWTHVGDNLVSDVQVPSGRGISARHYVACHLNANERVMERASGETGGLGSLLAGAARWTRLQSDPSVDTALVDVASGIGAPVIYAFVLWVLLEARRRGLKRVWFMARDGQVMLPVARTIAARLGIDVEVGYLFGGRQVVRVASLTAIDEQALEWLTGGAGVMTLQAVLDRVGLSVADVRPVADALSIPLDAPLSWSALPRLKELLKHPDVAVLILKEAALRRAVVLDYFRDCGLLDDGACAVVDIGWRGNVLRSIVDLIGVDQAARHTFMYFGSYAHAKGCDAVEKIAYLFNVHGNRRVGTGEDIPSMTTLMEIFGQADHGQVMSLERAGDGFRPLCRAPDEAEPNVRWNIPAFQALVARFAESVEIAQLPDASVDLRGLCDRLLRRLATHPDRAEVELLAHIGFVDDQGGSQPQPFAHAYGWDQLRPAFRSGDPAPRLGLNWWVSAAVLLTPTPIRWGMRLAAKVGRLRIQHQSRLRTAGTLRARSER